MAMNDTQGTAAQHITHESEDYPGSLRTRLGANAPEALVARGDRRLLRSPTTRTSRMCHRAETPPG